MAPAHCLNMEIVMAVFALSSFFSMLLAATSVNAEEPSEELNQEPAQELAQEPVDFREVLEAEVMSILSNGVHLRMKDILLCLSEETQKKLSLAGTKSTSALNSVLYSLDRKNVLNRLYDGKKAAPFWILA